MEHVKGGVCKRVACGEVNGNGERRRKKNAGGAERVWMEVKKERR